MVKKTIISLIVASVLFFALAAVIYFILKSKSEEALPGAPTAEEKTMEEKISTVTAPERTEPLTQAEKQRIEKLLKSVTAP